MGIIEKKKKKETKIDAEIVGGDGRKIAYIVLKADNKTIPETLYKLQHPGNLMADEMQESMIVREGDDFALSSKLRTQRFFQECVFPVRSPGVTALEKELIQEYGGTEQRPDPDELHPSIYRAWGQIQTLFFGGDLWDFDIEALAGKANGEGDSKES